MESLTRCELFGIWFLRDYIVFDFDGPNLQALNRPWVRLDGCDVRFPDTGSRDALCSLIGRPVVAVEVDPERHIRLSFADDATVTIPLGREGPIGVEAAIFCPGPDLPLQVFE